MEFITDIVVMCAPEATLKDTFTTKQKGMPGKYTVLAACTERAYMQVWRITV